MGMSDIRREYLGAPFDEQTADADPFRQFSVWYDEVAGSEVDATAMALATVSGDGRPSVRVVLLKQVDARGFVFYTNYESRKGHDLAGDPRAALAFYWPSVNRQVRVEGSVEQVSAEESDAYFASRPPDSRLAAVVSPQSRVLESRAWLEARFSAVKAHHPDADVPRPAHWGGYRVLPDLFEFWQGRASRLHDRLRYTRQGDGLWVRERLAP
jgi:pyridoxamine 5'-phosphate oxidase